MRLSEFYAIQGYFFIFAHPRSLPGMKVSISNKSIVKLIRRIYIRMYNPTRCLLKKQIIYSA